ncbi:unannotated protein [freshwater metagenome]|uniref:Unannotated protein n=1 Tax=freshwater metagenome TaxID=449393 RepID=A0A6J7GJT0_9ZZZZ
MTNGPVRLYAPFSIVMVLSNPRIRPSSDAYPVMAVVNPWRLRSVAMSSSRVYANTTGRPQRRLSIEASTSYSQVREREPNAPPTAVSRQIT